MSWIQFFFYNTLGPSLPSAFKDCQTIAIECSVLGWAGAKTYVNPGVGSKWSVPGECPAELLEPGRGLEEEVVCPHDQEHWVPLARLDNSLYLGLYLENGSDVIGLLPGFLFCPPCLYIFLVYFQALLFAFLPRFSKMSVCHVACFPSWDTSPLIAKDWDCLCAPTSYWLTSAERKDESGAGSWSGPCVVPSHLLLGHIWEKIIIQWQIGHPVTKIPGIRRVLDGFRLYNIWTYIMVFLAGWTQV